MKTILTLLFLSLFFFNNSASACPIWKVGEIRVIDEKGKIIPDAVIWNVYNENDSFRMRKGHGYFKSDTSVHDSSFFEFWDGGYRIRYDTKFQSYYRIKAKGYADLIVKAFEFKNKDWDEYSCINVTLYNNRFIQKGNAFIEFTQYELDRAVSGKDTVVYGISEYTSSLINESRIQEISRKESFGMKTYPNPAREYLQVDITDSLSKPYKAVLTDAFGKSVKELMITEASTKIDLQFEIAGLYILTVFNGEGDLKYCMRFVKQ